MANTARGFTFEVYPSESRLKELVPDCQYDGSSGYGTSPDNWIDLLNDRHLQFVVSPLHCFDTNPDGTLKKPHWHVYMYFPGKKSLDQVNEFSIDICKGTHCQIVDNPIGMIRYFCHLDNPEKYQYDKDDLQVFGGLDIDDYFKVSKLANVKTLNEIFRYINARRIRYFHDLINDLAENEKFQWQYTVMCTNTLAVQSYLSSARQKRIDEERELREHGTF